MKKALLSLASCALLLSACTSEDTIYVGPQSNVITFKNVVNKSSRALDTGNFNQFFVFGYYTKGTDLNTRFSIFTDTPVSKSSEGWSSAINRYWVNGANYSFYAFSCENNDIAARYGGASVAQNDGTFRINYTCHTDDGNSHDLVFASATGIQGKDVNNEPVALQFKHLLSKVSLRFVSEFPEGYEVEISNISISDFENMGTFIANKNGASEGTWDPNSVKYDPNVINTFTLNALGSNITSSDKDEKGNYIKPPVETSACFMIPNKYLADGGDNPVKIKFNIRLINPTLGNQTIASNTLVGSWHPNWRQGTQYVYTVHLSGSEAGMEKIEFNVGVTDWNNPDSDNVPEKINISLDYVLTTASEE